jgi:hypothetical protein
MIVGSFKIGSFHSNLEEDLAVHFLEREASESDRIKPDGTVQDDQTKTLLPEVPEMKIIPEVENVPDGRKRAKTIKDLFRSQEEKQEKIRD